MKLRLNHLENARRSLARIVREYAAGTLDSEQARTFGYLLGQLLAYFRAEQDLGVLPRLEALERALNDPVKTAEAKLRASLILPPEDE